MAHRLANFNPDAYAKLLAASAAKKHSTSTPAAGSKGTRRKQRRNPHAPIKTSAIKSVVATAPTTPEDHMTTAGVHASEHQLAAARVPWR